MGFLLGKIHTYINKISIFRSCITLNKLQVETINQNIKKLTIWPSNNAQEWSEWSN